MGNRFHVPRHGSRSRTENEVSVREKAELAIFDLDNTLIGGDSDSLWVEFLAAQGLLDEDSLNRNADYYRDYLEGSLDMQAFLAFQLEPLSRMTLNELKSLRQEFLEDCIRPLVLPRAQSLVRQHEEQGHETLIITATNRFVTAPIAGLFGIGDLIAVDLEVVGGRFTGRPLGIPSFREGKVRRLLEWQRERRLSPRGTWFYSDSHNDLPLLNHVDHPVAVDPDPPLREEAVARGWPVISLR